MSYTVDVWEQPAGVPFPSTWDELEGQVRELYDLPPPGLNPKFLALGQALLERFAYRDDDDADQERAWQERAPDGRTDEAVWRIALSTRGPLDNVQAFLAVQANAHELNLLDGQAGEVHLSNGTKLCLHDRGHCVQAIVALGVTKELPAALAEFRRLAQLGNRYAQHSLGAMYYEGMGHMPNRVLGSALVCLSGTEDTGKGRELLSAQSNAAVDALLARMQAPGSLLQVVDGYLAEVAQRFAQGDEAARRNDYAVVLDKLLPLADEGHPRAKFILSLMHAEGRGAPKDMALAVKWVTQAAQAGDPDAQHQLGAYYEQGVEVVQDHSGRPTGMRSRVNEKTARSCARPSRCSPSSA